MPLSSKRVREASFKRKVTERGCEFQPRSRRDQPGAHAGGKVALRESSSKKRVKCGLPTSGPGQKKKRPAPEAKRPSGSSRAVGTRRPEWIGAYGTEAPGHARMRWRRVREGISSGKLIGAGRIEARGAAATGS